MKKLVLIFFIFHFSFFILKAQQYYLYGATSEGGKYDDGVLFRFNPFTGQDTILFNFSGTNGSSPFSLTYSTKDNLIYGITAYGGTQNDGVLYQYNLSTNVENTLIDYTGLNGDIPAGKIIIDSGKIYGTTGGGGQYAQGCISYYNPLTNKDTAIFSFYNTDGKIAYGGLFMFNDTSFYGMTTQGGQYSDGVIYRFNPVTYEETVLFNFNGSIDGAYPQGTFIKDSDGLLYGLVTEGGNAGDGTLISFNPLTNQELRLITFNGTNGKFPFGNLFLATNGLLYGMAAVGGSKNDGVIFSYNVSTNQYKIVLNFDSIHGKNPDGGNLIEDTINKILYSMTYYGGKYNDGVIFSYNLTTGKDSVLLNFNGTNGANPQGTLLLIPDTLSTGMRELSIRNGEVRVYPNPSNGQFAFAFPSVNENCNVEIYNILGEKVYSNYQITNPDSYRESSYQIDLSNQPNGVYLYRIINETGELVGEGKVILQK